jgi:hypothetical protein
VGVAHPTGHRALQILGSVVGLRSCDPRKNAGNTQTLRGSERRRVSTGRRVGVTRLGLVTATPRARSASEGPRYPRLRFGLVCLIVTQSWTTPERRL